MDFWKSIIGFKREEFECQDNCGFNAVDVELLSVLMDVKQHFTRILGYTATVTINSGCRCKAHNETVQRNANPNYVAFSSKSKHMYGTAADFRVGDIHEDDVVAYLEKKYPDKYGIGRYIGRTHLDVRPTKARW
jgi:uncharacterized protein YcbK (DUF882 family)